MSAGRLVSVLVVATAWLLQVADLVGPFSLQPHECPAEDTRAARVRAWLRSWPLHGRQPVRAGDWLPHRGALFLPTLSAAGLTYAGCVLLFGRGAVFRPFGVLALAGGLALLALIVGYLARPASGSEPARFPTARPGYRAGEVDAFFAELDRRPPTVLPPRFPMAAVGYDVAAVQAALDEWAGRPGTDRPTGSVPSGR